MAGAAIAGGIVAAAFVAVLLAFLVPILGLVPLALLVGLAYLGYETEWDQSVESGTAVALVLFAMVAALLPTALFLGWDLPLVMTLVLLGSGVALAVHALVRGRTSSSLALVMLLIVPWVVAALLGLEGPGLPGVPAVLGLPLLRWTPVLVGSGGLALLLLTLDRRAAMIYGGAAVAAALAPVGLTFLVPLVALVVLAPPLVAGAAGLATGAWDPAWLPLTLSEDHLARRSRRVRRAARRAGRSGVLGTGAAAPDDGGRETRRYAYPVPQAPTLALLAGTPAEVEGFFAQLSRPPVRKWYQPGERWKYVAWPAGPSGGADGASPRVASLQFGPYWRSASYHLAAPPPLDRSVLEVLDVRLPGELLRARYHLFRSTAGVVVLLNPLLDAESAIEHRGWLLEFFTFLAEFAQVPEPLKVPVPVAVVALPGPDGMAVAARDLLADPIPELRLTLEHRFAPDLVQYYALSSDGRLRREGPTGAGPTARAIPELLLGITRSVPFEASLERARAG